MPYGTQGPPPTGITGAECRRVKPIRISVITESEKFVIASADREKLKTFIKNIEKIIKEDV